MALSWLKDRLTEVANSMSKVISQYSNREYSDAAIAVAVFVAYADGKVDPEEIKKLNLFFTASESLKNISSDDLKNKIRELSFKFDADFNIGKIEALKQISKFRNKSGEARSLANLAVLIAKSDGNFEAVERKVVEDICKELDLDPKDFLNS